MAGWKKKLRYPSESPWFLKYYIGWIVIGDRHHETSNTHWSAYKDEKITKMRILLTTWWVFAIYVCKIGPNSARSSKIPKLTSPFSCIISYHDIYQYIMFFPVSSVPIMCWKTNLAKVLYFSLFFCLYIPWSNLLKIISFIIPWRYPKFQNSALVQNITNNQKSILNSSFDALSKRLEITWSALIEIMWPTSYT